MKPDTEPRELQEIFDRLGREYQLTPSRNEDGNAELQGPWYALSLEDNRLLYLDVVASIGLYDRNGRIFLSYTVNPPYLDAQISFLKSLNTELSDDVKKALSDKPRHSPKQHTVASLDDISWNGIYLFLEAHIDR